MAFKQIPEKLYIPLAVIAGCAILGYSYYSIQVHKQSSIDRQAALENTRAELKLKQDECDALSAGVKRKWSNIIGVTYDDVLWHECVVTFTDPKTGEVQTSPLRLMQDSK